MPRVARPWFRFYSEALESLKVHELPDRLFKPWLLLLCLANVNRPRGTLPSLPKIAFGLRVKEDRVAAILSALIDARLIDYDGTRYAMHDWDEWQAGRDVAPSLRDESAEINHGNDADSAQENHDRVEKSRNRKDAETEQSRTRTAMNWPDPDEDGPETFRQVYKQHSEALKGPLGGNAMLIAGQLERKYGSEMCIEVAEAHGWDKHPNYYRGPLEDMANGKYDSPHRNGAPTPQRPAAEDTEPQFPPIAWHE